MDDHFVDDHTGVFSANVVGIGGGRHYLRGNILHGEWIIFDVFVEEEHRRMGFGRRLVEAIEETARSRGLKTIHTGMTEREAFPFWQRLGYVQRDRKNKPGKWTKEL